MSRVGIHDGFSLTTVNAAVTGYRLNMLEDGRNNDLLHAF
jgi:hypothetical protein